MAQGDTNITVVGNIVADPELRFTPAGAAVANFRVASTPRRYNSQTNQWEDGEAMFLTCNVWRQAAENVAETLTKGMRIIVTGRLKQRSFQTREGENRTVFEIDVDEVGPSLRYATAQVNRNPREGGGNYGGGQQQRSNNNNQGGFGGQQQQQSQQQNQAPAEDPWNSAPPAGGFGGADSEPPF
ncbi:MULTISPECIES: single-stranded DNA-binding protein [unclassified Corynebacterium]|uniref:single-stranded DNA-binding protein n=1 Tax=unclassified Corynebacterium TaxID=2624378 RepID=UPI00255161B1|nr:single-stranded DNA-binding protein [Corynebacterium sp. MSK204]MDK8660111.1 single-stranded DNA-binding protein [Corynebacterium sp. MSK204]